jgi:two-component system response regulator FixJ
MISQPQYAETGQDLPECPQPLIAVVDDDLPFLRSVGRLLRSAGFRVETFGSGREFLAAVPDLMAGCVLVDVHMPEMTGLQLQETLGELGIQLPLIFITAYDSPQTREHARRPGCAGLLLKPFERQALIEAIWRALSGSSFRQSGRGPGVTLQ